MTSEKIAQNILKKLEDAKINAYIWCEAKTGSVYIRFENPLMNSIRIANHNSIQKYKYKYNVRTDYKNCKGVWKLDDKSWRYFISYEYIDNLINLLKTKHKEVKTKEPKYSYNIPKHKQNATV